MTCLYYPVYELSYLQYRKYLFGQSDQYSPERLGRFFTMSYCNDIMRRVAVIQSE
ncbi:hypothetical protein CKO_00010 [Citrobacter koseri ATCC BAA-895]|uniref:Uncharacterized protein n=1 Tax=Citrobacter koseri (strain ATCC BAA-895 / CDC 4225-83 / SGSC4696) TaxID=290338 RepID=A8ACH6_CITK8|nr:hypothetical protein CKO_00010 [Citrobacter koseri ATCC BAA-895]